MSNGSHQDSVKNTFNGRDRTLEPSGDPARLPAKNKSHLDDKARQIIEILQKNGRASYTEIAKQVGISEVAVRSRVVRLEREGVIDFVAVTNPNHLGFYRQAMIGIKVEGPVSALANELSTVDRIIYVVQTAGRYDLLIEAVCKDDQDLVQFKDQLLAGFPNIRDCEIFVYLHTHKQTYSWGGLT